VPGPGHGPAGPVRAAEQLPRPGRERRDHRPDRQRAHRRRWEGWLQPDNDLAVTDVVTFGGIRPDNGDERRTAHFPSARATGTSTDDLDALARDWLTYWLLDMGRLARVDFEHWIAGWTRPDFLRLPELA
jgi:hypothetical protein